jgi:carbamate kinase
LDLEDEMLEKRAVVALGGNAITTMGDTGWIPEQFARTKESMTSIVELVEEGYALAVTHGNGPQIGNALLRVEASRDMVPPLPLEICVADLMGGMGYMIEQVLRNCLADRGILKHVVTIVTQVLVNPMNGSLKKPSKPVGPYYEKDEAERVAKEMGWTVGEIPGKGYRRLVPSPRPLEIVEKDAIKRLIDDGNIVIAAGGGGVPVLANGRGGLNGLDGVIDKDLAAGVLARDIGADLLLIVTDVDRVHLNHGTPQEEEIESMNLREAKEYLKAGHFPSGSMGPKIEAAIQFLESGGREVIITSIRLARRSLDGNAGTKIVQ